MYSMEGGCPGPPQHRALGRAGPQHFMAQQLQKPSQHGMLSAADLTGMPLISYVPSHAPRSRKLRKKTSEPVGQERLLMRQRHASDHSVQGLQHRVGPQAPSHYYLGQNLYQKMMADQNEAFLQDFYRNPAFSVYRTTIQQQPQQHQQGLRRHHPVSKSFDNLSDTFSVSSDESENFIPRIIRPRRRRKKEKRRGCGASSGEATEESSACLGSEKQWLPTGLLSAESSFDSKSEGSASSEEEVTVNSLHLRRKLAAALSVPAYASYTGSDYSSMASSSDTPPSSSTDQLFDSDSAPSSSSSSSSPPPTKQVLKQAKSSSCSYFRSPKVSQKKDRSSPGAEGPHTSCTEGPHTSPTEGPHTSSTEGPLSGPLSGPRTPGPRTRPLRKTHSWAFSHEPRAGLGPGAEGAGFSLFSPGSSIDLLSGIRQNLSRLDLRSDSDM